MDRAKKLGTWCAGLVGVLVLTTAAASTARAQVKPGDFITTDNAQKVSELVSPGQYVRVTHGMTMKIVPTERIDWPPPYKDATEKYASQVRLTPDHRSLIGYVAGEPFPIVDANDPDAGTKVMWNVSFRPISSDEYDLRWFDCDSVYWGKNAPFREIVDYEIGHYAGYNEVGRTEVEPLPVDPDFKQTGRYFLGLLYPVLAPASDRGTGIIKFRYADPTKEDASWTWTPGARRVRRLNYAILDTASGPQAYDPNHYEGFSGKNENYDWKFLGEKNMLGAINVSQVPDRRCKTDGGASHCPDEWEMRHMFVVEGRPRSSRFSSLYQREILYVDSEADFVMSNDMYDRSGELFNNYTSWMRYADRAEPDARIAIYPFKREFQVGSSTANVQSGFSSVCYHPSMDAPSHDAWFINMGSVDRNWFTAESMARAAEGGHAMAGD
ncbi:MAG: DUF1329 domain-containing protein [Candidatus Binataceae bacterium]